LNTGRGESVAVQVVEDEEDEEHGQEREVELWERALSEKSERKA
jgi:hypothetical protein